VIPEQDSQHPASLPKPDQCRQTGTPKRIHVPLPARKPKIAQITDNEEPIPASQALDHPRQPLSAVGSIEP
jgi:hypothetical protein